MHIDFNLTMEFQPSSLGGWLVEGLDDRRPESGNVAPSIHTRQGGIGHRTIEPSSYRVILPSRHWVIRSLRDFKN